MLKHSLFIIMVLFPIACFALPCPNGRGILYKGDSIDEVIKQCGQPVSAQTTSTVLSEVKQFAYNRPHPYDPGYTQLVITLTNDRVSQIHIYERYVYYQCQQTAIPSGAALTVLTSCGNHDYFTPSTNLCGRGLGIGATKDYVISICGSPVSESTVSKNIHEVTQFTYRGINNRTQTMIFENGKLSEWK